MDNERNQHQIIRKDARNCFVESLNDAFAFGKVHLGFASYDTKLPAGQRQTNSVHIYICPFFKSHTGNFRKISKQKVVFTL